MTRRRAGFAALAVAAIVGWGCAATALAVSTSFWTMDSATDFLQGEQVVGTSIDSDGYLTLGPAWDSVATHLPDVAYIWCLARDSKGRVYFGTGDNGGIYRWTRGEGAKLLWKTGATEITAMTVDGSDNVYAASAPGGEIFRVSARGDTTRYFKTGEESVWSLLTGRSGALYAGTGPNGKVFEVTGPGKGRVYAETRDVNVLALAWAKDGALLAGTSSKGLLVRIDGAGKQRVIYDSDADEIRSIAVLPDGSVAVGACKGQARPVAAAVSAAGAAPYAVEVTPTSGGRSGVFLVQPDGSARLLYAPSADYIYAMVPADDQSVWVATGDPGAIFRVSTNRKYALLGAPDEKQVLALIRSGGETFAATGNPGVLYALGSGTASQGTYLSDAHDLRSVASWGRAVAMLRGGDATWSSRSGLSQVPDEGWSDWSPEEPLGKGGAEIKSPAARFLQYRIRLKKSGADPPMLSTMEVSYRQRNLPPEIGNIQVFGPDNPFMEGGPEYRPPQISQTFPNGLKVEYSLPKTGPRAVSDASAAWARGVRTVTWDAIDPNGDDLTYDVLIRSDDEKDWRKLATDKKDRVLSWDAESYANGTYRIKVIASDRPDNPPDAALITERMSAPIRIDNVPPQIEGLKTSSEGTLGGRGVVVSGAAVDADSRIGQIEYSVDGGDWVQIFPDDGIYDQRSESFHIQIRNLAPGEHTVTVRASDQDRNVAIAKVVTLAK
ncbi:MAG: two-component regulator propeller domain-containing protein [Bacteroidota bacterium]